MIPLAFELASHSPIVASSFTASLYAITLLTQWAIRLITNPGDRFWEVKSRTAPATLTDPAFGKHSFLQTKNIKFHMVENGDRSKPLLLMIHGYPEFWYTWRYQLKEFSTDYWCVAVDMRGFGDSDKPQGIGNYTLDFLVDDIKEIITSLGREKCTLISRDWGGIIGWSFVTLYPQMVDSYVIMNSVHPTVVRHALFHSQEHVRRVWYLFFYTMKWLPETRGKIDDMAWLVTTLKGNSSSSYMNDKDYEAWKYTFGKPDAFTGPLNNYRANFLFEFAEQLKGKGHTPQDPPGMVLFGTNEQILDLVQKDSAAMMCNTRYVEVEGASHFLQQDDPT